MHIACLIIINSLKTISRYIWNVCKLLTCYFDTFAVYWIYDVDWLTEVLCVKSVKKADKKPLVERQCCVYLLREIMYKGRSINKLQNGIILLVFTI